MSVEYCCSYCDLRSDSVQFILNKCNEEHPEEYFLVEKIIAPKRETTTEQTTSETKGGSIAQENTGFDEPQRDDPLEEDTTGDLITEQDVDIKPNVNEFDIGSLFSSNDVNMANAVGIDGDSSKKLEKTWSVVVDHTSSNDVDMADVGIDGDSSKKLEKTRSVVDHTYGVLSKQVKTKKEYCTDESGNMESNMVVEKDEADDSEITVQTCDLCNETFKTIVEYHQHIKLSHEEFQCGKCLLLFPAEKFLVIHEKATHSLDTAPFQCSICRKGYARKIRLAYHMRGKHPKESGVLIDNQGPVRFNCKHCGRLFATRKSLFQHYKLMHALKTPLEVYRCKVCSRSFSTKAGLVSHSKSHPGKGSHVCQVCDKRFINRMSLDEHLITHVQGKYECKICEIIFASDELLKEHLETTHTGSSILDTDSTSESLSCKICLKVFLNETDLENHTNTCKPLICGTCKVEFTDVDLLKDHLLTHTIMHAIEESPMLKCDKCTATFPTVNKLTDHKLVAHYKFELRCDKCNLLCRDKRLLSLHKLRHNKPFRCFCGQEFLRKHSLELHETKDHHSGRRYKCNQCEERFTSTFELKYHSQKHKTLYTCGTCKKSFNRESAYQVHLKRHEDKYFFICEVCQNDFKTADDLNHHIKMNTTEEQFTCPTCRDVCTMRCHAYNHMDTMEIDKVFVCPMCDRRFLREFEYHHHIEWHQYDITKNLLFCYVCKQTFTNPSETKEHYNLHIAKSEHQCTSCLYYFESCSDLDLHVTNNSGKTIACQFCDKTSELMCHLNSHMSLKISDPKPFQCKVCDSKFREHRFLITHVGFHMRTIVCKICKQRFAKVAGFKNHLKVVHSDMTTLCKICGKVCKNKMELHNHSVQHAPTAKVYECSRCSKTFTNLRRYREHLRFHQDAIYCSLCNFDFQSEMLYEEHMQAHYKKSQEEGERPLVGVGSYPCIKCKRMFFREAYLKEHVEQYHQETEKEGGSPDVETQVKTQEDKENKTEAKTYKCHRCDVYFDSRIVLRQHFQGVHNHFHCVHHKHHAKENGEAKTSQDNPTET